MDDSAPDAEYVAGLFMDAREWIESAVAEALADGTPREDILIAIVLHDGRPTDFGVAMRQENAAESSSVPLDVNLCHRGRFLDGFGCDFPNTAALMEAFGRRDGRPPSCFPVVVNGQRHGDPTVIFWPYPR